MRCSDYGGWEELQKKLSIEQLELIAERCTEQEDPEMLPLVLRALQQDSQLLKRGPSSRCLTLQLTPLPNDSVEKDLQDMDTYQKRSKEFHQQKFVFNSSDEELESSQLSEQGPNGLNQLDEDDGDDFEDRSLVNEAEEKQQGHITTAHIEPTLLFQFTAGGEAEGGSNNLTASQLLLGLKKSGNAMTGEGLNSGSSLCQNQLDADVTDVQVPPHHSQQQPEAQAAAYQSVAGTPAAPYNDQMLMCRMCMGQQEHGGIQGAGSAGALPSSSNQELEG